MEIKEKVEFYNGKLGEHFIDWIMSLSSQTKRRETEEEYFKMNEIHNPEEGMYDIKKQEYYK